jgi:glucose-6-phosphate dehydrogenase assembly protein OpcA
MRLSLDGVEREMSRLWADEWKRAPAARVQLLTLAALVSEAQLLERAEKVTDGVARAYPMRTIVAAWKDGVEPSITAEAALHKRDGAACGDAISLEAIGAAREWLPENIDRLALPDLPVCVWWVGDLPDFDDLFDRLVVGADLVVVNSGEMDLRDLEKLSHIAQRSHGRYAVTDLTWVRLRPLQDFVARFFDDHTARTALSKLRRIVIQYSPRENDQDAASTIAALFFGWMAHALGLKADAARWTRGDDFSEVVLGELTVRFQRKHRDGVVPGGIVGLAMECEDSCFELALQPDQDIIKWSRELPGVPTPPQLFRLPSHEEHALLVRCLERPKRDPLFEASILAGSAIARLVAPRLSRGPRPPQG